MAQKVAKEKEDWENCLVAKAQAIDVMVSINVEEDLIEDSEYNAIDQVEKKNIDVIISKDIYIDGNLYGESIEEDVWEVEFSEQSSAISRSVFGFDQILEANGDDEYQIEEEADIEVSETNNMFFESSEAAKKSIEEMIREYGSYPVLVLRLYKKLIVFL
ncbi:hypothetical protein KY284_033293 [Solanum tuberosum]|nr:hypothetical protein KY284_033293 [Solanum tuberosum]